MRQSDLTSDDRRRLFRLPLFSGLSEEAVAELLAHAYVQTFDRNASLFLQGDSAERFYVVLDGWVKLYRSTERGEESVIGVFAAGESFAEAAIFDEATYPVSGLVVEDARLLVVPAKPFVRYLVEHGDKAVKMMAAMSRHMRQLVQQVERLTIRSSTERVAEFLGRLCPRRAGATVICLPMDKSLIAGRLGMQPETFSRSLAKLRPLGVIADGPRVSVADAAALWDMVGGAGEATGAGCAPVRKREA